MQNFMAEEVGEMSRGWPHAQARRAEPERPSSMTENNRAWGLNADRVVYRLWSDGHNPGSFESNHGCWDHFRKIG